MRRDPGERAANWVERAAGLTLVPVDLDLARAAARDLLRGYDAVYLALAARVAAPLVTLDNELRRRASAEVDVLGPGILLATWLAQ